MEKIKWWAAPTQTHELSYIPSSVKEIHWALWSHGIPARLFKLQGYYCILYNCPIDEQGNKVKCPKMVDTGCSRVWSLTLKQWVDLGNKHCPDNIIRLTPELFNDYKTIEKVKNSTI